MGNWLKRIGIASIFAFPLAVVLYRLDVMGFRAGIKLIQYSAFLAIGVFVIGLGYFLLKRNANSAGAKAALVGAIIAIIPVIPLMLQAKKARSLPFIHNVSTDTVNAPAFDQVAKLRTENDNPHVYNPLQTIEGAGTLAELQKAAYPNLKTLQSDLSAQEAMEKAESVARSLGWDIVNVDLAKGLLEATETTLLWGFKDDVVIRVQESAGKTLIDLRSVSRFGGSDLGANAARIETFLNKFVK